MRCFALLALGRTPADPLTARQIARLASWRSDDGKELRLAPCVAPVWTRPIAMVAIEEAGGRRTIRALIEAARWLLESTYRSRRLAGQLHRIPTLEDGVEFRTTSILTWTNGIRLNGLQPLARPDQHRCKPPSPPVSPG